jgi:DNA repair protein RecN (Recombination protein N)
MLGLKCLETARQDGKEMNKAALVRESADAGNRGLEARTLIFDEVDAGIGGVTAQHVGARLGSLAKNYQVLCITHLPQIAARADNHLKVEKELLQKDVKVRVVQLVGEKRREELARMLGGRVTDKSLLHAEEMLELDGQG